MLFEMVRRLLFVRVSQATQIEIVNKKIIRNLYRETKCREISMLNCAFKSKFLRSFQKFNVISKKFCTMQNSTFIKNLQSLNSNRYVVNSQKILPKLLLPNGGFSSSIGHSPPIYYYGGGRRCWVWRSWVKTSNRSVLIISVWDLSLSSQTEISVWVLKPRFQFDSVRVLKLKTQFKWQVEVSNRNLGWNPQTEFSVWVLKYESRFVGLSPQT